MICKDCGEEMRFMWVEGQAKWWCNKCQRAEPAKKTPVPNPPIASLRR
jgi:tRNA(Ile2) C34 agmatinyltransferase TiaS